MNLNYLSLLLISFLFSCSAEQKHDPKPNIILIVADDLGYGDLGCYGNDTIKTPALDNLAKMGVRFTDFHSNGAVCSPTRAALMTGRYQQRAGIEGVVTAANHRHTGLPLKEVTLAEFLKSEGYTTGLFGKWHLGYDTAFSPINQGFDEFKGFVGGNVDYISHYDQVNIEDWWHDKKLTPEEGYQTHLITNHALKFIEKNTDNPFFLYVPYGAPHYPLQLPGDEPVRAEGKRLNPETPRPIGITYRKMIEIMDEGIGEILNKLKENNLLKNSFIVFMSDNGATWVGNNNPFRGTKATFFEGGQRVPAIFYYEGKMSGGTENKNLHIGMDIYPTIVSLLQSNSEIDFDGINIMDSAKIERTLFWRKGNQKAVRSGQNKLVIDRKDSLNIFNLANNPSESINLKDKEPEITKELLLKLKAWEEEMNQYEQTAK